VQRIVHSCLNVETLERTFKHCEHLTLTSDISEIVILNAEPPDFPRNLHVIEKGSRHINLGWTTSQDGNSPITQYIIEYKTESGEYDQFDQSVSLSIMNPFRIDIDKAVEKCKHVRNGINPVFLRLVHP